MRLELLTWYIDVPTDHNVVTESNVSVESSSISGGISTFREGKLLGLEVEELRMRGTSVVDLSVNEPRVGAEGNLERFGVIIHSTSEEDVRFLGCE